MTSPDPQKKKTYLIALLLPLPLHPSQSNAFLSVLCLDSLLFLRLASARLQITWTAMFLNLGTIGLFPPYQKIALFWLGTIPTPPVFLESLLHSTILRLTTLGSITLDLAMSRVTSLVTLMIWTLVLISLSRLTALIQTTRLK